MVQDGTWRLRRVIGRSWWDRGGDAKLTFPDSSSLSDDGGNSPLINFNTGLDVGGRDRGE